MRELISVSNESRVSFAT